MTTTESRTAGPEELADARATLTAERRRVAALSLFARRMSHDMSNFVTVVRTYSELLLADLPPDGTTHADVQEIHRAADAMIEYMHRIVRFARSNGTGPGALQLDESIADAVHNTPLADRVRVQLASDATVFVDAGALADSVRELITNACEASPASSLVHVRSWREVVSQPIVDGGVPIETGTYAVLEVADEGPGFSEDVRADALDPFVTTKHAVRGAGFGLSLARSTAWSGGGQLVMEATNATQPGTRVRMWLPAERHPLA
ncbi:MAG: HAMP domain-containing sensor histidine kinase [Gemmatimonadaceae bacterium]